MSKVRINDLARELEVKSRAILDALTHVGVTEKKTHSSSLEEDEAERVRQHFQRSGKNGAGAPKAESSEPKQKIDWSRVSKPGDVLKAIQQRKDEAAAIAQRPPLPPAGQAPGSSSSGSFRRPGVQPGTQLGTRFGGRRLASAISGRASSGPEHAAGERGPQRASPTNRPTRRICPGFARSGPAKSGWSQPGWARSTDWSPTTACPATDRTPAPAGAADRGGPAAARPGHFRQTARWTDSCQATAFGSRRQALGGCARYGQARSPRRRRAPTHAQCGCGCDFSCPAPASSTSTATASGA